MLNKIYITIILASLTILFISPTANAQFGKNKVQYQEFNWKYIQSEHFDVYYNAGSKYLAEFAAIEAEKALESLQSSLSYNLAKRVILVVYDTHNEFQQTNVISSFMPEGVGGVTELFKNRVVVPFMGDYSQLRHVVHHELTHAVLNDMFYGGTFQSALSTSGNFQIPLWMNEGLSEWESIGGMNTETDMFMRDLTISENLPSLERLDGYLAYRGGQTFYWYVADRYGKEKVGELINKLRIMRNVDAAFRSAFNMSFEDFSEKWERDIKKIYWPDLQKFEDPKDYATALTNHKKENYFYNSSPAISPEGDRIAFISDRDGTFGVFVMNLNKKEEITKLTSSFRQKDFEDLNILTPGISWDPTGKRIAISAKSGGEDAIFIVDADDGDYEKIELGLKSISSVNWSTDGNKLMFIGSKREQSDIFTYDLKTKKLENFSNDVFSELFAVWSYDSKHIYFISDRRDNLNFNMTSGNFKMWDFDFNSKDIYRADIDTKEIERLTFDPENNKTSISVSRDESKILYTSDANGIGNIYQLDVNSKTTTAKTNSIAGISQISLAHDDSKVILCAQTNGGYDLFVMRNPFERTPAKDTLPMTDFRMQQIRETDLAREIISTADSLNSASGDNSLKGYGNFDVSFKSQQLVQANLDVGKPLESETIKGDSTAINTNFVENDYKVKFSPDVILGNPGYSTFYGAQGSTQMLFSDVMGDHQIYFMGNIITDLRNSQFLIAYSYLPKIIDYHFTGFHMANYVRRYNDFGDVDWYRFSNSGLGTYASYPLDLFNRFEAGVDFAYMSRENVIDPRSEPSVNRFLILPSVGYVHDDVLWGMYAPAQGTRWFVNVKGSPKLGADGRSFVTTTADYRFYATFWNYLTIAGRGAAGGSFGPNPPRFFMGGTENWINSTSVNGPLPFDEPEDYAFMQFEMPLRGWDIASSIGTKFFLTNAEMRFPIFAAIMAGPVPVFLQGVMGAFFLDVGGAWDNTFVSYREFNGKRYVNDLLLSTGVGLRTYVLGFPLKLDIAWIDLGYNWSQPRYVWSLGFDF